MAITFPANPSAGDDHTEAGVEWKYDGEKWVSQAGTGGGGDPGYWDRDGTTLSPVNAGDDVEIGSGNISLAADGYLKTSRDFGSGFNDVVELNTVSGPFYLYCSNEGGGGRKFSVDTSGSTSIAGDVKIGGALPDNPNITLQSNGDIETESTILWQTNGITNGYMTKSTAGNGAIFVRANGNDGGGANGVLLERSATSWTSASQLSLKTDLVPIENGLVKISSLSAVTGRYKVDPEDVSRSFLIADEFQSVLPEAVSGDGTEENPLGLRYTDVIPLLLSALKEAKTRIEALEAEVQSLKEVN